MTESDLAEVCKLLLERGADRHAKIEGRCFHCWPTSACRLLTGFVIPQGQGCVIPHSVVSRQCRCLIPRCRPTACNRAHVSNGVRLAMSTDSRSFMAFLCCTSIMLHCQSKSSADVHDSENSFGETAQWEALLSPAQSLERNFEFQILSARRNGRQHIPGAPTVPHRY